MTKKLKVKFYCPGPERQVMKGAAGGAKRSKCHLQPESYKHYEKEEMKELKQRILLEENRKRARMLRNIKQANIPSWLSIPTEFGEISKAGWRMITYNSYKFGEIKVLWNYKEQAVEVRFAASFFYEICGLLSMPSDQTVLTIDRRRTRVYVVQIVL